MPIDCSQKVPHFIAVCVVHSPLLAWISSVHIEKVLTWLCFKKVYVLKASFGKTFLQITECLNKFPSIYNLAQLAYSAGVFIGRTNVFARESAMLKLSKRGFGHPKCACTADYSPIVFETQIVPLSKYKPNRF